MDFTEILNMLRRKQLPASRGRQLDAQLDLAVNGSTPAPIFVDNALMQPMQGQMLPGAETTQTEFAGKKKKNPLLLVKGGVAN